MGKNHPLGGYGGTLSGTQKPDYISPFYYRLPINPKERKE